MADTIQSFEMKMEKHMDANSWDPLEAAQDSDQEIITAAKKREIKNILKSYVGTYDPMSELIQNAMDSVEKRQNLTDGDYEKKIIIKINIQENFFQVIDNGVGFSEDQFRAFIAPNISFKKGATSRGNKGVGATYIAYGFNNLEIRTKNEDFEFDGHFKNGREWIEDDSGIIHRPQITKLSSVDNIFSSVDQGSSFKIKFGDRKTRPSSLSWYQANTPEQWLYLLLIKTPLGHINIPSGLESSILFDLVVVDSCGEEKTLNNVHAKYKFPHDEIKASQRLSVIREVQTKAIENSKDPSVAIEKYKNSNGIYDFFSKESLLEKVRTLSGEDKEIIDLYSVCAYGYFSYSTAIWDKLNDDKAKLRKNYRVLRGGLQLANNHMVQGELITIPLTKSIGHQHQAHIIVHFSDADPDLGRKGFQPELKALAERIAVFIVSQLSSRRDILKGDTGEKPDIEREVRVHEWIREQEKHESDCPLILTNENFFLPIKKISVNSIPLSEQDVIVLFNQLLAGGVIRGIKLLSTSQVSQYDGIFRYVAEEPFDNLIFDEVKNPLGVYEEQLTSTYIGPPKILEYKFSLDGLIREFESNVKNEKDISLVVFWEFGEEYKRDYTVTSLLDFEHIHHRPHHGVTHIVKSANNKFYAICLKELVDLLNDPQGCQEQQKTAYAHDLF